jgi:hypothetical protein
MTGELFFFSGMSFVNLLRGLNGCVAFSFLLQMYDLYEVNEDMNLSHKILSLHIEIHRRCFIILNIIFLIEPMFYESSTRIKWLCRILFFTTNI